MTYRRIVLATLGSIAGTAPARAAPVSEENSVWLSSEFLSQHVSNRRAPSRGWNETNGGIGIEYSKNENWRIAGGVYNNSIRNRSDYAHVVWSPDLTTWCIGGAKLSAGVAAGAVDGYRINRGGFFPTLLPVASLEGKRLGLNMTYIPSVAGNVVGAFATQIKVRVY